MNSVDELYRKTTRDLTAMLRENRIKSHVYNSCFLTSTMTTYMLPSQLCAVALLA